MLWPSTVRVELPLDPCVLASLCRRGRKKLKQLERDYPVHVLLDRQHQFLAVTGPEDAVAQVKKVVNAMVGPRIKVRAPLWAELLRTRSLPEPECLVETVQSLCDCRVHIERSQHEVRIFGEEASIQQAEAMLRKMESTCIEKSIPVRDVSVLSAKALEDLADDHSVSLRLDATSVALLGTKDNVERAAVPVQEYVRSPGKPPRSAQPPSSQSTQTSTENSTMGRSRASQSSADRDETTDWSSSPTDSNDESKAQGSTHATTDDSGSANMEVRTRRVRQSAPTLQSTKVAQDPLKSTLARTRQRASRERECRDARDSSEGTCDQQLHSSSPCPTCGCGTFCTQCGAVIRERVIFLPYPVNFQCGWPTGMVEGPGTGQGGRRDQGQIGMGPQYMMVPGATQMEPMYRKC